MSVNRSLEDRIRTIEDRLEIYNLIASHPPSADTAGNDVGTADATNADEAAVARVLRNIQDYAHFAPHKTMPLYSWWVDGIGKGGS